MWDKVVVVIVAALSGAISSTHDFVQERIGLQRKHFSLRKEALFGTFAITGCIPQMVTIILFKIDNVVLRMPIPPIVRFNCHLQKMRMVKIIIPNAEML